MQVEVGAVLEGKVTGITKFGAFVDLGEGKTGMVHISEVASTYVKEIRDFITEGQTVKVKVLTVGEDEHGMNRNMTAQEELFDESGALFVADVLRQLVVGGGEGGIAFHHFSPFMRAKMRS